MASLEELLPYLRHYAAKPTPKPGGLSIAMSNPLGVGKGVVWDFPIGVVKGLGLSLIHI